MKRAAENVPSSSGVTRPHSEERQGRTAHPAKTELGRSPPEVLGGGSLPRGSNGTGQLKDRGFESGRDFLCGLKKTAEGRRRNEIRRINQSRTGGGSFFSTEIVKKRFHREGGGCLSRDPSKTREEDSVSRLQKEILAWKGIELVMMEKWR